jgi:DNA repair ATPase RecN
VPLLDMEGKTKNHWWFEDDNITQLLDDYHKKTNYRDNHRNDPNARQQYKAAKKKWCSAVKAARSQ